MAGRHRNIPKGNFEKLKREMAVKKKKAEVQLKSDVLQADIENIDLIQRSGIEDVNINAAVENIDTVKIDYVMENNIEEDVEMSVLQNAETIGDRKKIQILVFRVDEEEFALRTSNIKEIIRIPSMTKVPNAPMHIIGMCSLRGELLPVIDSRKLFGMRLKEFDENSRIIVADIHGMKVGLISDKVSEVLSIEETDIASTPTSMKGIGGGVINGILTLNRGKRVVVIIDVEAVIRSVNCDPIAKEQNNHVGNIKVLEKEELEEEQIVIFSIGAEEFAFNIDFVKEIIRMPEVTKVPNTAHYVEGMFYIRKKILAVINLRRYLGIDDKEPDEASRVIIINNGILSYGVIVDRVSHVVGVHKGLFRESSKVENYSRNNYAKGIYNLNNGNRLILMLEPHKLISLEDAKSVANFDNTKTLDDMSLYDSETENIREHIVIFTMDQQEYAIEINHVKEINIINEMTHFPGAPDYVDGMVDLRGDLVPVLNLGRMLSVKNSKSFFSSKFLVVEFRNRKIGILIDAATEVLRFSRKYLEEAPVALRGNDQVTYVDKIAKLNDGKRIVLILNLSALLNFL